MPDNWLKDICHAMLYLQRGLKLKAHQMSSHIPLVICTLFKKLLRCVVQQVHDAGHMVPMDQPKAALEMLKRWTSGNLSEPSSMSQKLDFDM